MVRGGAHYLLIHLEVVSIISNTTPLPSNLCQYMQYLVSRDRTFKNFPSLGIQPVGSLDAPITTVNCIKQNV